MPPIKSTRAVSVSPASRAFAVADLAASTVKRDAVLRRCVAKLRAIHKYPPPPQEALQSRGASAEEEASSLAEEDS
jgi:hypothetical protein